MGVADGLRGTVISSFADRSGWMQWPIEALVAEATKDTQVMTVRMPRDVYEGLRALSFATDTSINEHVLRAVGNHMTQDGHQELVEAAATRVREQYRVALTEQYRFALDKLSEL